MKVALSLAALLLSSASIACAQQPVPLHNGQQITLRGTLAMRPGGRLQFAAVATAQAYLPAGMDGAQPVRTVGLSGYHRYELLYAHRGQPVVASGTVMVEGASPYYLNGVLLKVSSLRLADGTDLMGAIRVPSSIAVDVGDYRASVVLPADLAQPWQYSAHGMADPDQHFLSCSSNGGGDVVNCTCAKGFHAVHAESPTPDVSTQVFSDSQTVQFGMGEQARRTTLIVTCSR